MGGIPAGATIEHAYLYWVTYGTSGSLSIKLGGATIAGTAIGTSAGTCWKDYPTFKNFVYRADVTAKVSGNGPYVLTGFPSGGASADSQGASLFIVYSDPSADVEGHVVLMDGAITVDDFDGGSKTTFPDVMVPSTIANTVTHAPTTRNRCSRLVARPSSGSRPSHKIAWSSPSRRWQCRPSS